MTTYGKNAALRKENHKSQDLCINKKYTLKGVMTFVARSALCYIRRYGYKQGFKRTMRKLNDAASSRYEEF